MAIEWECTSSVNVGRSSGSLSPTVQGAMNQSLQMIWRNQSPKTGKTKTSSSLSEYPYNKQASCSFLCSLLIRINALKHIDASFSEPKQLSQLWNCHGPLSRVRQRFLSFFKGALLPNPTAWLSLRPWIW